MDNEEVVDEVDKEEKKEQGESISQKASTIEGSIPVFNFAKDETEGYSFALDYNETSLNEDGLNSEFTTEKQKLTDSDDRENNTEEDIVEEKEIDDGTYTPAPNIEAMPLAHSKTLTFLGTKETDFNTFLVSSSK